MMRILFCDDCLRWHKGNKNINIADNSYQNRFVGNLKKSLIFAQVKENQLDILNIQFKKLILSL
jgi:hypothetical protein